MPVSTWHMHKKSDTNSSGIQSVLGEFRYERLKAFDTSPPPPSEHRLWILMSGKPLTLWCMHICRCFINRIWEIKLVSVIIALAARFSGMCRINIRLNTEWTEGRLRGLGATWRLKVCRWMKMMAMVTSSPSVFFFSWMNRMTYEKWLV